MTDKHLYLSFSTDFKGTLKLTSSFDLNEVNNTIFELEQGSQHINVQPLISYYNHFKNQMGRNTSFLGKVRINNSFFYALITRQLIGKKENNDYEMKIYLKKELSDRELLITLSARKIRFFFDFKSPKKEISFSQFLTELEKIA